MTKLKVSNESKRGSKRRKKISQYKSIATIFSSNLPICPVYFHLVMPRHVLSPCYARYEHTRGIDGYVTY
jgi:predicted 2-oxoglutarate/Fe(II)-dependent dioxygenase YbiX